MIQENVIVKNKIGIHARPASMLINCALKYKSNITITKGNQTANLYSLVSLLKLKVKMDDSITICTDGEDEAIAMNELLGLINSKFGEE